MNSHHFRPKNVCFKFALLNNLEKQLCLQTSERLAWSSLQKSSSELHQFFSVQNIGLASLNCMPWLIHQLTFKLWGIFNGHTMCYYICSEIKPRKINQLRTFKKSNCLLYQEKISNNVSLRRIPDLPLPRLHVTVCVSKWWGRRVQLESGRRWENQEQPLH